MKNKKILIIVLTGVLTIFTASAVYFKVYRKTNSTANIPAASENINNTKTPVPSTTVINTKPLPNKSNIEVSPVGKWGNTPDNIANGGLFAQQDGYLYFNAINLLSSVSFQSPPQMIRSKEDGITALTKLQTNDYPMYINVVGEWIYFCTMSNGELCRMKVNGESLETISSYHTSHLIVYNNTLYYIQNNNIYKSSIESLQSQQLIAEKATKFTLSKDGNFIFFYETSQSFEGQPTEDIVENIYTVDINGQNKKHIFQVPKGSFMNTMFVHKNYIYFNTWDQYMGEGTLSYQSYIYRVNTAVKNPKIEVYVQSSSNITLGNISDKYLYYSIQDFNTLICTLYRKNLDNNAVEKIELDGVSYVTSGIYVFGDTIYCTGEDKNLVFDQGFSLYRIDFNKRTITRNQSYRQ